ncbi:SCO family protein [Pedobacter sp. Du54]|uniref:SCO family protein n=1 Tax=Pedobacter anseongensis TaxID=3133439 RepID=UPI00309B2110
MYQTVSLKNSFWLFMICFIGCINKSNENQLPYYNTPDFSAVFLNSKADVDKKINHKISSFSLTDQHGDKITDQMMEGKIHVANFIFTSCNSICPIMTKHMKKLQSEFGNNKEVAMLSFSVMPWIDNVDRLKNYATENQIKAKNWHLLTGNKTQIYNLARKDYFAEEDLGYSKDSTSFLHTEHIVLVDKTRRIRGIYNGTLELEANQLIKDIKLLLKEE